MTLVNKNINLVYEINQGAILAMLTDVHMWKKDYAAAINSSAQFSALPYKYDVTAATHLDYRNIFTNPATSKEAVWTLNWDYVKDGGNEIALRIGSSGNTSNYEIDSVAFLKFEADKNDIRRAVAYDTNVVNALNDVTQIWKFYDLDPITAKPKYPIRAESNAKLPLYRTADVLLLRAEALNKTGDKAGAFAILNKIRTLRKAKPLVPTAFTTIESVENAILDERQMELFAESRRWFDLVRTGKVISAMDPLIRKRQRYLRLIETGFTDPRKILWPISRDALTRNSLLTQNAPYSE